MKYLAALLSCLGAHVASSAEAGFPSPSSPPGQAVGGGPPYSQHIFNVIHSSMRQWGSSLNHNGMSFFLATIPIGTQFYHGRGDDQPVKGMEWLAFEPEHALNFARMFERLPNQGEPPQPTDDDPQRPLLSSEQAGRPPRPPFEVKPGWLHTYTTKRDLQLVYIDGMAAAKCNKGTLDSQDYVLRNGTDSDDMFRDADRGKDLCSMARHEWSGSIDGFIRMEHGFEIIMCSFADTLHRVRVTRASLKPLRAGHDLLSFFRAITARYDGIGGHRVVLDYDHFITAYAYPDLHLGRDSDEMPRLLNLSRASRRLMRSDLRELIAGNSQTSAGRTRTDWRSITDEIVQRYANRLTYLASGLTPSRLKEELGLILSPFIDHDARDREREIARCAGQFIPAAELPPASLAASAIHAVSYHICHTLRVANETSHSDAMAMIHELIDHLDWTTWKKCPGGCAVDELCLTAIWPWGTREIHDHPKCFNASALPLEGDYWWNGQDPRRPPVPERQLQNFQRWATEIDR